MQIAERMHTTGQPRPRTALVLTLMLVASLLVAGVWFRLHTTAGPLGPSEYEIGSMVGIPANVGDRVAAGLFAPVNASSGALVIDSIAPDAVPPGLRVLGYRVTQAGIGSARAFPPAGVPGDAVRGWVVQPGHGVNFVIGLEPLRDGTFTIPGFTVRYHEGWHRYTVHYGQAVRICAPLAAIKNC